MKSHKFPPLWLNVSLDISFVPKCGVRPDVRLIICRTRGFTPVICLFYFTLFTCMINLSISLTLIRVKFYIEPNTPRVTYLIWFAWISQVTSTCRFRHGHRLINITTRPTKHNIVCFEPPLAYPKLALLDKDPVF